MINEITTIDREGQSNNFNVQEISFELQGSKGIEFQIRLKGGKVWQYFVFKIIFLDSKILIYQILNNDHPEVTGKGIVRAMIKAISEEYKRDIISSTRIEELKIDISEGRIDVVSEYWQKWRKDNPTKILYNQEEDRFTYKYESNT